MARGYTNKDWWHNYQIYRKKEILFDNISRKNDTPCFTYLPWVLLKKGDRIHLEIWAPDNHSKYLEKEQAVEFVKLIAKIRPFQIKIVEEGEKVFAIVWYKNKFQTFSALTALRYAGEDNWNNHWPIVPFVLKYRNKGHILKLLNWAHIYIRFTEVYGNSGHSLLYIGYEGRIKKSSHLKEIINRNVTNLNENWSGKGYLVYGKEFYEKKKFLKSFYEDIRS